jgi:hypothetical protein
MTGYTYDLVEKNLSFKEFTIKCARAIGYLIEMRDEPLDAPIPDEFEPDSYYLDRMYEAEQDLVYYESMTKAEKIAEGKRIQAEELNGHIESLKKSEHEERVLKEMLVNVEAWNPPTEEHEGLKKFMLEQLKCSMHDSNTQSYKNWIEHTKTKNPESYIDELIERSRENVPYYKRLYDEEVEQTAKKNAWIKALRAKKNAWIKALRDNLKKY